MAANLFLAHWTDPSAAPAEQTGAAERRSLGIYLLLGCGTEVASAVQTLLLTLCSLRASRVLHACWRSADSGVVVQVRCEAGA